MKELLEAIKKFQVVTIFRHVLPDGDALGSQFGLAEIIATSFPEKKIYCLGEQEARFASLFPESSVIKDEIIAESLAIVCDTANWERISDQRYSLAKEIIKVDHHPQVQAYGNYQFVDTSFSSCAEIIADFLIESNLKISAKGAQYLFTGIMTDTGRLSFGNVTPRTYRLLSLLTEHPFNQRRIFETLSSQTANDAHLRGYILNNFNIKDKVASLILPLEVLEKYGVNENAASLVNLLSGIDDCECWILIGQGKEYFRVELRSRNIAVNEIARRFNGGGHHNAAGAKIYSISEAGQVITAAQENVVKYLSNRELFNVALKAARIASEKVLALYDNNEVSIKDDDSPVTNADIAANDAIIEVIKNAYPSHFILSEERADDSSRLNEKALWIIDPIDGTQDYINKTGQFAINIAFAENGVLQLGVVVIPAQNCLYFALAGAGAYKMPLDVTPEEARKIQVSNRLSNLRLGESRFHTKQEELDHPINQHVATREKIGSAYKLCLVAEGKLEVVFKLGSGTKEWDVAAPDILIKEAGGVFVDGDKQNFVYNRPDVANRRGYIALNNAELLKNF